MTNPQSIGDNSSGNQQIQGNGEVMAPFAKDGGIAFGGDNHGVVITSVPTPEDPQYTFDLVKKTRIPSPAALIGLVSGLITIGGFVSSVFSFRKLVDVFMSSERFDISTGILTEFWWLIGSLLAIAISFVGWVFLRFLRRNVLRLPKHSIFRAWAGIKEANGRTYPYSLRLAMRCPKCKSQKLRFQQVPADGYDLIDLQTGACKKRVVTEWKPMAVCPRNKEHSIPVDISGNDFDEPLLR